jgi:hypothetical protein
MTSILLAVGSFLGCLLAGTRSLKYGLAAIIGVGYIYGIARANYPDTWTYLMFDVGAIGLYLAQLWKPLTPAQRIGSHDCACAVPIGWPLLLFIAFPRTPAGADRRRTPTPSCCRSCCSARG